MDIIKKKKKGEKGYPEYLAKSAILIYATVFGFAFLVIIGTVIYLRLTMY